MILMQIKTNNKQQTIKQTNKQAKKTHQTL